MKKALCMDTMFLDHPFEERAERAHAAGFHYAEIDRWTEKDVTVVRAALGGQQLRLASMYGGRTFVGADESLYREFPEYLSQSLAMASFFACLHMVVDVVVPEAGASTVTAAALAAAGAALAGASEKASRVGVTLLARAVKERAGGMASGKTGRFERDDVVGMLEAADAVGVMGKLVRAVSRPSLRLLVDANPFADDLGAFSDVAYRYRDVLDYLWLGNGNYEILPEIGVFLRERLKFAGFLGMHLDTRGREDECLRAIQAL